jgi:peptidyl-tRNA hydrolase, PTH1 family
VVDLLAGRYGVDWASAPRGTEALIARARVPDVTLVKPLTFMNASGPATIGLLQFFKIELLDLFVVVDEVHLELGRLRARAAGSAGGHNGLKSIIGALGSSEFARLRVGVGRGDSRRNLADHVLARFDPSERETVAEAVGRAADAAELFVAEGIAPVMNRFNRSDVKDGKEDSAEAEKEDPE